MQPNELTIHEAARKLRTKELTVRDLFDACHAVAVEKNKELNIYLELFFDAETDTAIAAAQERIDTEGDAAPLLCGIPIAIKDNILLQGRVASAASKMLENYTATYDATIIQKLKAHGAILMGRANMDEFAMGSSTEHSAFMTTKNPHDPTRVPGGSSGGSAAAVAAHTTIAALGTDTGGSIRQPAAFCGIVGFKPTYGAVSRHGLIAMGSSLDQAGPLTKTVADAKVLHDAMQGTDPLDSTTIPTPSPYPVRPVPTKFRIGVPRDFFTSGSTAAGLDPELLAQFEATLARLQAAGHEIVDIALPTSSYAIALYYVVMFAEVSTNLSRLDGIRYGLAERGSTLLDDYVNSRTEGFGKETQRRILLGTFVLSSGYIDAYYRKADAARAVLTSEYDEAFKTVDVIAFPTTPSPAFKFGEKSDPVAMYLEDIFTVTANLTGMPAISVPMGTVAKEGNDLPVGIQFTAPKGADDFLFAIGQEVEQYRAF
jgi:aspartyl-tRNA(Asn)/glutamyl-tRNA(Gln) amidotransferase subunit A